MLGGFRRALFSRGVPFSSACRSSRAAPLVVFFRFLPVRTYVMPFPCTACIAYRLALRGPLSPWAPLRLSWTISRRVAPLVRCGAPGVGGVGWVFRWGGTSGVGSLVFVGSACVIQSGEASSIVLQLARSQCSLVGSAFFGVFLGVRTIKCVCVCVCVSFETVVCVLNL